MPGLRRGRRFLEPTATSIFALCIDDLGEWSDMEQCFEGNRYAGIKIVCQFFKEKRMNHYIYVH